MILMNERSIFITLWLKLLLHILQACTKKPEQFLVFYPLKYKKKYFKKLYLQMNDSYQWVNQLVNTNEVFPQIFLQKNRGDWSFYGISHTWIFPSYYIKDNHKWFE